MYLSENIIGQLNKKIGLGLNNLNLININGMIFSDKGEIISSGAKEQYNDEQLIEGVNSSTEEITDQSVAQTQIYNDSEAVDEKNKNKTDPHVIFDNNLPKNIIVTSLQHAYNDSDSVGTGQYTQEYEETRIDGIQFPLIQVDTMVFNEARVEKMVLNYREMVPSIYLEVDNSDGNINQYLLTQYNNIMKVIFTPAIDGTYKKVSLRFTINSQGPIEGTNKIYFSGTYKLESFYKKYCKDIQYKDQTTGDIQKKCNTWEMLYSIASECNLGFAATDECRDVNDRMTRLMKYNSYLDIMKKHVDYAGSDEDNVLDYWVDLYGYITLVNVAWVFRIAESDKSLQKNLKIYAHVGLHGDDRYTPEETAVEVDRTLTNYAYLSSGGPINLSFNYEDCEFLIDNYAQDETFKNFYELCITSKNGKSSVAVNHYNIENIQNSADAQHTEEYQQEYNFPVYINNLNNFNNNKQNQIRDTFFNQKRQRVLKMKLTSYNLGLQRGTLVNVVAFSQSTDKKQQDLMNTNNMNSLERNEDTDIEQDPNIPNIIFNQSMQTMKPEVSGVYYIDGMEFEYVKGKAEITQYLYLLKTGNLNSQMTKGQFKVDQTRETRKGDIYKDDEEPLENEIYDYINQENTENTEELLENLTYYA